MSKRFGRNQKRAMRNKIQNQCKLLEHHIGFIDSLNVDLRHANEIINRTADILGEHFASLPVKTKEVKEIQDRYRYSVRIPSPSYVSHGEMAIRSFVDSTLSYIETHEANMFVDELRHTIHMRYQSLSGCAAYGLSEKAWRSLSEDQLVNLIKEQIAPEMASHLVRQKKKSLV